MSFNNQAPSGYSYDAPQRNLTREILLGLGLTTLLHLIQIPLIFATGYLSLIFFGLSQLIYIVPAIIIFSVKKRPGVVIGLIIGASLTFLLYGVAFALTCAVILNSFK